MDISQGTWTIAGYDYGPSYGNTYTIQSSNSLQFNEYGSATEQASYTYTKLGPNLGSISISSSSNSYSAALIFSLFPQLRSTIAGIQLILWVTMIGKAIR